MDPHEWSNNSSAKKIRQLQFQNNTIEKRFGLSKLSNAFPGHSA